MCEVNANIWYWSFACSLWSQVFSNMEQSSKSQPHHIVIPTFTFFSFYVRKWDQNSCNKNVVVITAKSGNANIWILRWGTYILIVIHEVLMCLCSICYICFENYIILIHIIFFQVFFLLQFIYLYTFSSVGVFTVTIHYKNVSEQFFRKFKLGWWIIKIWKKN